MKARLTQRNVLLETGSVLSLDDAQGWRLSCQRGRLWVTVEGSGQEVTLSQGRSVTIEGDGRVVVEADGTSVLTLCGLRERPRSGVGRVLGRAYRAYARFGSAVAPATGCSAASRVKVAVM